MVNKVVREQVNGPVDYCNFGVPFFRHSVFCSLISAVKCFFTCSIIGNPFTVRTLSSFATLALFIASLVFNMDDMVDFGIP